MKKLLPLTALCLVFYATALAHIAPETENFAGNLLKYPVVSLPKKGVANTINKKIHNSLNNIKKQHASLKGSADKISMSYKVLLENNERLNLLLYSWTYNDVAAHGVYYTEGLSYDLNSGKRIETKKYIGQANADELDLGIREGRYRLTGADNKPLSLTDFWKVGYVSKEALLNEDGSLTLVYQVYDLAPYAMGNTYITIPAEYFPLLSCKEVKPTSNKEQLKQEQDAAKAQAKADKEQLKQEQDAAKAQAKADKEQLKQEQNAAKAQAKEQAKANKEQQKLMAKQSKEYEKQVKAEKKAEYEQIKAEQKEALNKLKAEQKAKLEQYKAQNAKPKTKIK